MTADLVSTSKANPDVANLDAVQVLSGAEEQKLSLRQRIEKLLHNLFEGHKELLGLTPD